MISIIKKLRSRIVNPDSQHGQIAYGFLWVGLFVFIGKMAGAAKEMAIAWRYGVSSTVDAYVFIFNLISWPVSVWLSIITVVLLPLFAKLKSEAPEELPRFRSELFGLTVLIGIIFGAFCWWGVPALLRSGWLGLTGHTLVIALDMIDGMGVLGPLGAVISFFSTCLLATGRHQNTLFESIPALVLLIIILLLSEINIYPLVWGTLLGYILHVITLAISLSKRGELPAVNFALRSCAWPYFWKGIGILSVGQILSSLTTLIDQVYAAGMYEGVLSTLNYSNRILALLLGLGAVAISRATLPVFSAGISENISATIKLALRWVFLMFGFGLAVLIMGWIFAPLVVSLLFERGAFTPDDSLAVARILRLSLFQVIFYFPALVLVSVLAAQRRYVEIAASGVINLLAKFSFVAILSPLYAVEALVISTVLMYAVSGLLLAWFVFGSVRKESKL